MRRPSVARTRNEMRALLARAGRGRPAAWPSDAVRALCRCSGKQIRRISKKVGEVGWSSPSPCGERGAHRVSARPLRDRRPPLRRAPPGRTQHEQRRQHHDEVHRRPPPGTRSASCRCRLQHVRQRHQPGRRCLSRCRATSRWWLRIWCRTGRCRWTGNRLKISPQVKKISAGADHEGPRAVAEIAQQQIGAAAEGERDRHGGFAPDMV